jgi:hypothetical protein
MKNQRYLAFSDESRYNINQYRSIAVLSLPFPEYEGLVTEFSKILEESGIRELKYGSLTSAKMRFGALKTIDLIREKALKRQLRIDVIIWNITDSRHGVVGRDDKTNLQIMYYQLFKNIITKRWGMGCDWHLFPDEQILVNWDEMVDYLERRIGNLYLVEGRTFEDLTKERRAWKIEKIQQVKSSGCLLVQIADLFAGIGPYSWANYQKFKEWEKKKDCQTTLFPNANKIQLSTSDREKCEVLRHLYTTCNDSRLILSINHKKGLWTPNPENPINFWCYEPQSDLDKAPVKP